jgi:hypothetical protein
MDRRNICGAALILAGLGVVSPMPTAGRAVELAVSGRSNANASIAASRSFVAIAWGARVEGGPPDVYVAVSRDGGRTFGSPTRVSEPGGSASSSGEQPPRVTLIPRVGRDPSVVVVWTARAPTGTRLLAARSDDGGKSFAPPAAIPGAEAPGNRGWQAVATDRAGYAVAIWLDHRELARAGESVAGAGHAQAGHAGGDTDGVARAQLSKLFFARLDGTSSATAITGGVCYCCKTAVATSADGSIYAAWRHVYAGNVRDIAFTMSRDGGQRFAPPVRVSEDNWVLDGCPEDGPGMAVGADGRIHVVWPTLVPGATPASEPTLALFYAASDDGRRFTRRQRMPTEGVPRHPQIATDARGGAIVVWEEQAGGTRRVALGRSTPGAAGSIRFGRQIISGDTPAVYPVVAATEGGIVAAWTSGPAGRTVLHTAVVPQ